jgi:hypothetical protein
VTTLPTRPAKQIRQLASAASNIVTSQLGYVFQRRWLQPYESIVGLLWKFARLNRLPGHAVAAHLCARTIDPYEGIEPFDIDVRLVAQMLDIAHKSVSAGIGKTFDSTSPHLRYCPRCLNQGYHAHAHQLLRIRLCPIHEKPLLTLCRHCGRTSAYRLDAQLLDAPFRCRHCRGYHTRSGTAPPPHHFALEPKERTAIIRAILG